MQNIATRVAWSVCVFVCWSHECRVTVTAAKTGEPIAMPFFG